MIVSASYRTDIPAFYGRWFMNRLDAGFCRVVNPYGRQIHDLPLTPDRVDGFVFWTRNAAPFRDALREIRQRGYPFVVQFTVTAYPKVLEAATIPPARAVAQIEALAGEFGPKAVVWRYDPILVSDVTPFADHERNFANLAGALAGAVDEVTISFAQIYRKTKRNLDAAARAADFAWRDPGDDEKRTLAATLVERARAHGMALSFCAQPEYAVAGASEARCIDADRLAAIAGREITARTKGNRPGCRCAESRDIGDYDTCPHGCVYCYAVAARATAIRRHRAHDPESPFLWQPPRERQPQ